MNKQAYFKMMGLNKIALGDPAIQPSTDPKDVTGVPDREAPADRQEGDILNSYVKALNAPGQLGFWERLWQQIKSWFGSASARKALQQHDLRNQEIERATGDLNDFYAAGPQPTNPYQAKLMQIQRNKKIQQQNLRYHQSLDYGSRFPGKQKQMAEVFNQNAQKRNGLRSNAKPVPEGLTPKQQEEAKKLMPKVVLNRSPRYGITEQGYA